MLSIVYIMIKHSWKCNYPVILRYFIFKKKILEGGGGGMPSDSLLGLNNLSPHYMSVKVLGYTGLPFFHTCRVDSSDVDMATQIPIRRSWQWSRLKNSNGLKLQYHYLARSSICMPGIIVLVMNCHQRELYEAICFSEIFTRYTYQNIELHILMDINFLPRN